MTEPRSSTQAQSNCPIGPAACSEVESLRSEVRGLRQEIEDLQIALLTSNEHSDVLQEHLYRQSQSLAAEVHERQAAEHRLQKLVAASKEEKADLEILVQILIDEGDRSAVEGEQARIDALTQVANRRRFDEYLAQQWERDAALRQPLSLLICDVDYFKLYNDAYGHQAGDECLRTVAGALAGCLRTGDLIARYGGEEFAVVLPNTDRRAALIVGERARNAVWSAAIAHGKSLVGERVSVSIGASCSLSSGDQAMNPLSLIAEADRCLYVAKNRGRNRVEPDERI